LERQVNGRQIPVHHPKPFIDIRVGAGTIWKRNSAKIPPTPRGKPSIDNSRTPIEALNARVSGGEVPDKVLEVPA
jgi:hypothetical protein